MPTLHNSFRTSFLSSSCYPTNQPLFQSRFAFFPLLFLLKKRVPLHRPSTTQYIQFPKSVPFFTSLYRHQRSLLLSPWSPCLPFSIPTYYILVTTVKFSVCSGGCFPVVPPPTSSTVYCYSYYRIFFLLSYTVNFSDSRHNRVIQNRDFGCHCHLTLAPISNTRESGYSTLFPVYLGICIRNQALSSPRVQSFQESSRASPVD